MSLVEKDVESWVIKMSAVGEIKAADMLHKERIRLLNSVSR